MSVAAAATALSTAAHDGLSNRCAFCRAHPCAYLSSNQRTHRRADHGGADGLSHRCAFCRAHQCAYRSSNQLTYRDAGSAADRGRLPRGGHCGDSVRVGRFHLGPGALLRDRTEHVL